MTPRSSTPFTNDPPRCPGQHAARDASVNLAPGNGPLEAGPAAAVLPASPGLDVRMCSVAVALVGSGEVATIALEECDPRAAGLVPQNRAVGLARIEQAPAPPSAEEQGFRPVTYGAVAAGDAVGLASGEWEGAVDHGQDTCIRGIAMLSANVLDAAQLRCVARGWVRRSAGLRRKELVIPSAIAAEEASVVAGGTERCARRDDGFAGRQKAALAVTPSSGPSLATALWKSTPDWPC
jgi:hypothetical protein